MLVGAVTSIVRKFLRSETMEAKEITVATLFSLSLADENKIIIGASGAVVKIQVAILSINLNLEPIQSLDNNLTITLKNNRYQHDINYFSYESSLENRLKTSVSNV